MNEDRLTIEMVSEFLDAKDFGHDICDEDSLIRTGFMGRNGRFYVVLDIQGENGGLGIAVHLSPIVPEDRRKEMAEAVVRANNGLTMGRFDLYMSDGTMEYNSCIPLGDDALTASQFDDFLFCALSTTDRYSPAFYRLLYGDDLSPAEVIAEIEMAQ